MQRSQEREDTIEVSYLSKLHRPLKSNANIDRSTVGVKEGWNSTIGHTPQHSPDKEDRHVELTKGGSVSSSLPPLPPTLA